MGAQSGGPESQLPISELGYQILASDPSAGAQSVGAQSLGAQSGGPESGQPISELGIKVLASDPNAGAQSVGAQSLGAQRASNRFRI